MAAVGINNELSRKKNRKKRARAKYLEKLIFQRSSRPA